jgi:hypothetical protein
VILRVLIVDKCEEKSKMYITNVQEGGKKEGIRYDERSNGKTLRASGRLKSGAIHEERKNKK